MRELDERFGQLRLYTTTKGGFNISNGHELQSLTLNDAVELRDDLSKLIDWCNENNITDPPEKKWYDNA